MAESTYNDERLNNEKFQSVVRRKLERFRTKLTELFFSPNQVVNTVNNMPNVNNNKPQSIVQQPDVNIEPVNNSMLISNCYYGYTTPVEEDLTILSCKKKSKKFNKNMTSGSSSSSSSACSSSSSMIIDDDETSSLSQVPVNYDSLPQGLTGVITLNKSQSQAATTLDYYSFNSQLNSNHSNYDTSSLNTNEEDLELLRNPFLNKKLTDLIHFNSDLNELSGYFESALDLIDYQDNFFNIDFMTNYISYILLKQINDSNLLKQLKWDLKLSPVDTNQKSTNLLKDIAEQIFLESHDEPCGLKGCNISIFIQKTENEFNESQRSNTLVSKFQFGTSRFGVFDLNLFLKHDDSNYDSMSSNQAHQASSIATLTRRIFSANTTTLKSKHNKQPSDFKTIFLDSSNYDLFKTNIAYAWSH